LQNQGRAREALPWLFSCLRQGRWVPDSSLATRFLIRNILSRQYYVYLLLILFKKLSILLKFFLTFLFVLLNMIVTQFKAKPAARRGRKATGLITRQR